MLANSRPILFFVIGVSALWVFSSFGVKAQTREEVRIDVGGYRLNSVLSEPAGRADLPPIVFIHGASTSLLDPMYSFFDLLRGRAKLLFVDRPGHGRSDVGGTANTYPDGQADAIATLMERRGIKKAIIVSHSFGGAVAAQLAVRHKDMVIGLVFLSPAVYTWDGPIAWYYNAARAPVVGWLFSGVVIPPAGVFAVDAAAKAVFAPNVRPEDYLSKTNAYQAIAPAAFRHNAMEIANLQKWARIAARSYKAIRAPTVIITGDADQIVSPAIHANHLARDIKGAELIVVHNMGHKSDYVARDLAVAAIKKISGRRRDLLRAKAKVEREISKDRVSR